MAPPRKVLIGVGLAFAAWIVWGVVDAGNDLTTPPMQSPISIVGGKAEGHRLTMPSWTIDYDRMQASADGVIIQATGVHRAIIYRQGKPYVHLTADNVQADLATRDFDATGHVHAAQFIHGSWRTFDTTQAHWVDAMQKLTMPEACLVTGKYGSMSVAHLDLNAKTGHMHMGHVMGAVHF